MSIMLFLLIFCFHRFAQLYLFCCYLIIRSEIKILHFWVCCSFPLLQPWPFKSMLDTVDSRRKPVDEPTRVTMKPIPTLLKSLQFGRSTATLRCATRPYRKYHNLHNSLIILSNLSTIKGQSNGALEALQLPSLAINNRRFFKNSTVFSYSIIASSSIAC